MNSKALTILEYNKIIEQLVNYASSAPAKDMCRKLEPITDIDKINQAQTETADALARLFRKGSISFGNVREIRPLARRLEIGSSLSISELLSVAKLLDNVAIVRKYGAKERSDEPDDSLSAMFSSLTPLTAQAKEIRRCIDAEDAINDSASSTLFKIRKSIKALNDKIHTELSKIIVSGSGSFLQDSIITTRNGRYCVPVRADHRNALAGIVHDQSSSGSTIFVEPASVVNINNEIRQKEAEEEKEIEVILANLSNELAPYINELLLNFDIMKNLDFIFAKGHLAMEMNATRPIYNDQKIIDIKKARHPLIPKKKVVPIDIRIGRDYNLLIITGPNTGGKTVALKTTGLLVLMGQAGLHIPASARSELSIFKKVYADIGDEQSIEQSLSTFSSHMKNIVAFIGKADIDSLMLFDELGAGTDPTEGAALAISILSDLQKKGVTTMATTHYSELKIYALKTPGVENASCEFDVATLSPTYHLLIGVPGKSNAFAISSKLGLPKRIIENAKNEISEQEESFENIISDLEISRKKLENEREELKNTQKEIEDLKKELETKKAELQNRKSDLIRSSSEEARNILQNAKDYADKTIRDFNKAKNLGVSIRELEAKREKLRKKIDNYGAQAQVKKQKPKTGELKPEDIRLGDTVKVLSLNINAQVDSLPDGKGSLYVSSGILRTQVSFKDLEFVSHAQEAPKTGVTGLGKLGFQKSMATNTEINLLGKTVDEAVAELDKFIDDAFMAHLHEVRIVHGKGTGALREGIHRYLKRQKHVRSFRLGAFGEGDAGVTIAELK